MIVTAISVIPLRGFQLVRPAHSDKITPAIQIHTVPNSAMIAPRRIPISFVLSRAIRKSTTMAAATPIYSSRIGISSFEWAVLAPAAFCMLRTALTISGRANAIPVSAPPTSIPIPTGRNSSVRR
ncbi:MAG: hypothetical protein BWY71_02331 [Planctomycetes bacterium ADurb.Bin412]|nr:MAG: hypothetical protein BWY71_02331 [Planctomycetes bacterium ADurb.Bin412]